MNRAMRSLLLVALFLCPASLSISDDGNPVTPRPKVDLAFNRFYDYDEMTAALKELERAHPGWLTIEWIGKSVQGRDLLLVTLADPEGRKAAEKPAMYIDANVHGNEIQGTEVILYTIWYLLEQKGRLERVDDLLDRVAFYFMPTVNPDARHAWFHGPSTPHTPRTGLRPVDNDRDGRADEDGPDDLDGDGSITNMRKKVAQGGTHRLDPEDPRRLVRVAPGEEGDYLRLGWEGIDNDDDGLVNEDGPGGYDMNRNFPGDWRPSFIQHGAGDYPLCFPETRAVADFVLDHPNIAAAQSYHNTGGMILRGPGHKAEGPYPRRDIGVFDRLGEDGERILPHYDYRILYADLYPVRGGFVTWLYEGLGIFAFTNELWNSSQYSGKTEEEVDHEDETARARRRRERLRFDDEVELGRHFQPWRPFRHPLYGDIEIGGMTKASSRVPPVFMLEELCHRNMAFTLHHAAEMPRLSIGEPFVTDLGGGVFRVRAEVDNQGLIPSISEQARRSRIGLPDFFSIEVTGGTVTGGGRLEGEAFLERVVPAEQRPDRLSIEGGVPSHGRVRAEWIVSRYGTGDLEFRLAYRSQKGGTVTRRATGAR